MRSLALLGLVAACQTDLEPRSGDDTPDTASIAAPLVVATAPYRNNSPWSIVPDLGVRGSAPSADPLATDAWSIHEATFSNGRDSNAPGAATAAIWYPLAGGVDWAQFESAPAFAGDLGAAVGAASSSLGHLTDLSWLASVLNSFPLPIHAVVTSTPDGFHGWAPVQARWLRSQYAVTSSANTMTQQVYADPALGGEIRERGARLYCAARRAQFEQEARPSSITMGRQVALALSILGQEIDLGVIEPTFTLDGPQRFTAGGAADGAQAFAIPMLLGTALTPIDGIGLPGFGELRTPLVLVAGDTEVASAVAPVSMHTGDRPFCNPFGGCGTTPTFSTVSPRDYLTVTHAGAAVSRSAQLTVTVPDTPIFTLGVLTLFLNGSGTLTIGSGGAATPIDDRLLAGVPSGWPAASRSGGLSVSPWSPLYRYDDEPWSPVFDVDAVLGGTPAFALPVAGGGAMLGTSDPMLLRALADDDHHLATDTSVELHVGGGATIGFSLGVAAFTLTGGGDVHVGFGQETHVRDGVLDLMGNGDGYPMTALTVAPSTHTSVGATFNVTLRIQVPIPFDPIDEPITIVRTSTGTGWGSSPWPQANRALIATGSQYGDPTYQPWAVSHLPSSTTPATSPDYPIFDSFSQDVRECLADTRSYAPVPTGCQPTAHGSTPHGNLCVFTGSRPIDGWIGNGAAAAWAGACSDIPSHVDAILPGATAPQKRCYRDVLSALCLPASREQDWHGQHGIARIIDMVNPNIAIDALSGECASAFAPTGAAATFNRIFEFGVCDDGARMLEPTDVITATPTPPGTPAPVTPGTCH
ncbi:MAG TPA: hypothetical protein VLM79_20865 [Kofleriaceae bacterium]|nr:hypothetical protein [Kofleriaceae bacterium]